MPEAKILVVDDEEDVRERLGNFLARRISCALEKAASGEEALKKLKEDNFDLVLLDIRMPGLSGIDVMKETAKFSPQTKFLAISGYDSDEVADEALKVGAVDFVTKPQTTAAILLKVKDILSKLGKYAPKEI
jgi:two-component system nitrogen regulation response regulator NtrX